jgi:hypothetical protein
LKFFNIGVRVSGEGTEAFFNLRQVCKRKGNMNSHDTLGSSHLSEGVEGNWLAWGSVRVSAWGTQGSCGSELVGGQGDRKRREEWRKMWEEGQGKWQKEGQKEWRKEGWGPMVEQWQPVSDRVEAHQWDRKKGKHWSQGG